MKLSIQQVIDYQRCPLLYKFRWIDGVDASKSKRGVTNPLYISEYYDKALHNVIHGIFHQYADGSYPTPHWVSRRWGSLWNQGRTREDIVKVAGNGKSRYSPGDLRKYERQGLNALLSLHSDFQSGPGTPILIGKEYSITVGKHELTGTIDLIREVKDSTGKSIIEIVDFKLDDRSMSLHVKGDMTVTAAAMAFRKLFGTREDRITYYGILSRKVQHTARTDKDFELLERILDNVAKSICAGIIYPVMNARCAECPFHKHCEKKEWF